MFPKDTTATNSSKSFKFGENQKEKTRMEHRIIPCAEGDDEFIADKLNAITNSKIDFEDTIEDCRIMALWYLCRKTRDFKRHS